MFSAEPWLKSVGFAGWNALAPPRSLAGANLIVGSLQEPRSEALPPAVEELVEPVEPAEEEPAALPLPLPLPAIEEEDPAPGAAALPEAELALWSMPTLLAVTPRALLKSVAAEASFLRPLMAAWAVRQASTVAAGALHWSFRRSQMNCATMPGSVREGENVSEC